MDFLKKFREKIPISDFLVSLMLVLIISLMVIPLQTWMLDILLVLSMALGIMVLLVAIFLNEPLDFAAFPSILLVLTLFRLSLNISTTRLILSLGEEFDGEVIHAFAEFVTKGNFIVGVVAFSIITIVQFMVITKGSERVAEVAARFTLDAMPGKQMSIDADLNAGLIDANEARARRKKIEREATFFGSMDGANKFVRGDSIAGIIIVFVNIIGGILIGKFQQNLEIRDALETFGRLTIGDGLVTQVPALLISIATGLVITKSASEVSLGTDIQKQILKEPKAFLFTAGILFMFGLVPGLPTFPFLALAGGSALVGVTLLKARKDEMEVAQIAGDSTAKEALKKPENLLGTLSLDPISLKTGRNLIPLIDPAQNGPLLERITLVRYHIGQDLGFVIPGVRVMDDLSLAPNAYKVEIRGTKVSLGEAFTDCYYIKHGLKELRERNVSGIEVIDPVTLEPAVWVSQDHGRVLQELAIPAQTATDYITSHFSEVIKRHADEIMTRQNVQSLLELVKNTNAAIVRELVPDMLSLGQVHKVLQNLVKERVSIRDLSTILERLADYAHVSRDTNLLAEYVRQSLARQICSSYTDKDEMLTVLTIDPRLEETMIGSVHQSEYGSFLALDPNIGEKILSQLSEHFKNFTRMGRPPVVLCSPRLRPHFKRFTERNFPVLAVLSYNEVVSQVKVQSIGIISDDY
ncbi:MAG: flagellar biosynthesis protein FlhA [Candidatus Margulisiibacteriota bacterium]|nr:MAG: flagellar biosynthesis protein FlhA [Candidatus Margulisbacteria bacterium GWD2_39_127]OGI04581.1 MAG: flagellar biosynthesis protein FlhA [Candidatus Margulisbacteria bacterium GWF2_38_17]OGI11887.1 MAG: flagellar biosynthesis protein FlhA [Candidatus Margulisbacteria bacterium GWE2_39_32]PZM83101.1 MAG: flagellar biosynthesis protein FlhA [Candidatus Margulisiibacteriota bacterium]HAR62232.1 flagellar biosynthesis protein FlhA [Candidatus Margulisiibacteriota bacterium]